MKFRRLVDTSALIAVIVTTGLLVRSSDTAAGETTIDSSTVISGVADRTVIEFEVSDLEEGTTREWQLLCAVHQLDTSGIIYTYSFQNPNADSPARSFKFVIAENFGHALDLNARHDEQDASTVQGFGGVQYFDTRDIGGDWPSETGDHNYGWGFGENGMITLPAGKGGLVLGFLDPVLHPPVKASWKVEDAGMPDPGFETDEDQGNSECWVPFSCYDIAFPQDCVVGGAVEMPVSDSDSPSLVARGSDWSVAYAAGGVVGIAAVILGTSAWYVRKRWMR